jgi:hypothetical protein
MKCSPLSPALALFSTFAVFSSGLRADTLFGCVTVADGCVQMEIKEVLQVEDEVVVVVHTSSSWTPGVECITAVQLQYDTVTVEAPFIAVKQTRTSAEIPASSQVLWTEGVGSFSYNPNLGDGWVKTVPLGWAYLRDYPWVFTPLEGWICVREGQEIFEYGDTEKDPSAFYLKAPSVWFYSPLTGWNWKTFYNPWAYNFATGWYLAFEEAPSRWY